MTTQSLTTDDFLELLGRSGLVTPAWLEEFRERLWTENSTSDPAAIAAQLVQERLLTRFQSKQLLHGKHRGFFITGKYKVLDMLGQGGMGRVLLCEHLMLERLVALKLMNKSLEMVPGMFERFIREARAAASLDHPHIARVFDVDRSELGPYIVMEYVDGTNLHDVVARHGPLAADRVAHYVCQAAAGLQHAHQAGLVHRDIKPGNLILDRTGTIKLLDLGLARFFETGKNANLTQQFEAKSILGTADFIAPEQAMDSQAADIRADIYSLGCSAYFLLTGRLPFPEGSAVQKLLWHQVKEPESIQSLRPGTDLGLIGVVEKMLRKKPEERYQTPAEAVEALTPWRSVPIEPPPAVEMPRVLPSSFLLGLSTSPPKSEPISGVQTPSRAAAMVSTGSSGGHPDSRGDPTPFSLPPIEMELASRETPAGERAMRATAPGSGERLAPSSAPMIVAAAPRQGRSVLAVAALAALLVCGGAVAAWRKWGGDGDGRAKGPGMTEAEKALPAARPTPSPTVVVLRGGGSTFVKPVMEHWAQIYHIETGVKVEYTAVGSSKGVEGVMSRFLDFGCTDAFLSDQQLADAGAPVLHIPLVMGAVAPTYNMPDENGEPQELRFTGPLLANIYLGKIKKWNDPTIAVNNPGRTLPDLEITVVYRKEGSGTTSIWTDYLSKASAAWKKQIGAGNTVAWPLGVAAEKNDGVADAVSRTVGAIGYVEMSYALANGLPVGRVKNRTGSFVAPSIDSVTAAAAASLREIPSDLRYSLTDAPGDASYPIVGTCWAVVHLDDSSGRREELAKFLRWATSEGQAFAGDLRYARLPPEMIPVIEQTLDGLVP